MDTAENRPDRSTDLRRLREDHVGRVIIVDGTQVLVSLEAEWPSVQTDALSCPVRKWRAKRPGRWTGEFPTPLLQVAK